MANNKFENLINDDPVVAPSGGGTTPKPTPSQSPSIEEQIRRETYTEEESQDVNAIKVTIADTSTPIVVFFGSQASGKTLALMRMIRFLESNGYTVVPEEVFRPKTDMHYTRMCHGLKEMVYDNYTPGGTDVISFMLVKVLDPAKNAVCQILEAPGEHYFDGSADLTFPTYINEICNAPNRKVWVFFVEQGWGADQGERNLYAQKIKALQTLIPNDKVVFLFNKADKHLEQYDNNGRPRMDVFFKNIANQYPGIFDKYKNDGWLMKLLYGPYKFRAVSFSSGLFNETASGREVWTLGKDFYCADFWKAIN